MGKVMSHIWDVIAFTLTAAGVVVGVVVGVNWGRKKAEEDNVNLSKFFGFKK